MVIASTTSTRRCNSGSTTSDSPSPKASSTTFAVALDLIATTGRNRKLLAADWFDVAAYPEMRFRCLQVLQHDAEHGRIDGELTLRGVTRAVALDLRFNRAAIHKYSLKYTAGFTATTTIRRSDFGMLKYIPEIGDEIAIRLDIEGQREGAKRERKK